MSKASLELGGGNWAAKDRKLLGYAVGDTSGKYIPREFDFTRNSDIAATRVNKDGLIEKHRENLLTYSNQFDTTWTNINTTETSGQADKDGGSTAWLLEKIASSGRIEQASSLSGVQTFSVCAKAGSLDWMLLYLDPTATLDPTCYFDLANGLVGTASASVIDSNIEKIGGGWYRCSITADVSGAPALIFPADGDGDISGTSGNIYIQDAQLERGLVATDYLESGAATGKAGILDDLPRIDYTGGSAQLLLEPSRTNLITQSEYFNHTSWAGSAPTRYITITQVSETTPDGGSVAYKIQGTSIDNQLAHFITITVGDVITNSIYIKRVSGTGDVRLRDVNGSQTDFSLDVADGWKRIDVTGTATSTSGRFYLNLTTYTDEILVWGAQQEEGSYATSYIPTYGVSVTRSLDSCVATSVSDLIGQNQGTMFVDITINNISGQTNDPIPISLKGSGSTNSYISLYDNGRVQAVHYGFGSIQANINLPSYGLTDGRHKFAFVYSDNDFKLYIDGALAGSDTSGLVDAQSDVHLGYYNTAFNGSTNNHQALIFQTALTDAECIALTTL